MSVSFTDEGGHHVREGHCRECWHGAAWCSDVCKCSGKFHSEFEDEYWYEEENYLDITYSYRCDKCGSVDPLEDGVD